MEQVPLEYLTIGDADFFNRYQPNDVDEAIRVAFWESYQACTSGEGPPQKMNMSYVYHCTSKEFFYAIFLRDVRRLSYMMRPPTEYIYRLKGMLDLGLRRFSEILRLPLKRKKIFYNKAGELIEIEELDTALIANVIRVVSILDNRIKGSVVQKHIIEQQIQSKTLNMNIETKDLQRLGYEAPKSMREIEKELKKIDYELAAAASDSNDDTNHLKMKTVVGLENE